ncbi:hypothetical protein PT2222_40318 [Paraburkholderia tropica]
MRRGWLGEVAHVAHEQRFPLLRRVLATRVIARGAEAETLVEAHGGGVRIGDPGVDLRRAFAHEPFERRVQQQLPATQMTHGRRHPEREHERAPRGRTLEIRADQPRRMPLGIEDERGGRMRVGMARGRRVVDGCVGGQRIFERVAERIRCVAQRSGTKLAEHGTLIGNDTANGQ